MADSLQWESYAACAGMPLRFFHKDDNTTENYEEDIQIATIADEMCLSCPVIKQCLEKGIKGGEWGTWGGVNLAAGKIDKTRNSHKTRDTWKRWEQRVDASSD